MLALSDRYDVSAAKEECARALSDSVVDANCAQILLNAFDVAGVFGLRSRALNHAARNFAGVRRGRGFKELSTGRPDILLDIMERMDEQITEKRYKDEPE